MMVAPSTTLDQRRTRQTAWPKRSQHMPFPKLFGFVTEKNDAGCWVLEKGHRSEDQVPKTLPQPRLAPSSKLEKERK